MFTQIGSRLEHFVEEKTKADKILDARGWSCPWCILKAESLLRLMEPGKVLEVLVTDPQIIRDLPSVLRQSNDQLIKVDQQRELYRLYVRRGEQKLSGA
ncbi:MAG: sulfurtransferase TusA family protein [Deltaproteobacteria bacterium]|jgi:TusA-related sulfurtransferase|nr:MAG: sulfurtransferase TusA family protein [Deltaproteobacteria bacterium]